MKKLLFTIFILFLSISPLLAQQDGITYEENQDITEAVISIDQSSNSYFDLELTRGTQNPLNKSIPFTIKITPKIESSKTQIIWSTPSVFTIEKLHSEFVSLQKDTTYTYTAKLKPLKDGTYHISVNVVSWQFDSNKSASVGHNITINKSLTVQPIDTMYIIYLLSFILLVIGGFTLIIYLVIKSVKVLTKKAKTWLTPPI